MKRISIENIGERKQHREILNQLLNHPKGLTLHELTYLLTQKKIMHERILMERTLGSDRKDVFNSRQRIHDCLDDLKELNIIRKFDKKYIIDIEKFHLCILYMDAETEINKIMDFINDFKKYIQRYPNIFKNSSHKELTELINSNINRYKRYFTYINDEKLIELIKINKKYLRISK